MIRLMWYKQTMKTPKRIYLAIALLLFVGGAGTALALSSSPTPKKVGVTQTAAARPVVEATNTEAVTEPTVTKTAPVVTPDPKPTPEENREKLHRLVTSTAQSRGLSDKLVDVQWSCIDKVVSNEYNPGYADYDASLQAGVVRIFLDPYVTSTGENVYRHYDNYGSCAVKADSGEPYYYTR